MIDKQRLQTQMQKVSTFGALPNGGITRLAFSSEEKNARDYIKSLISKIGMSICEDAIGNIYATLKGDENLPSVATGSHVDSVPLGGCYDGTLGVMCALEAINSIKEQNIKHKRDITLIIFSCEESSRFNMATAGSKVISGKLDSKKAKELKDKSGISLYDAAKNFGCDVENFDKAVLPKDYFYSYVELHIEQGPVLENKNIPIGIVTGIAAPIRYELKVKGRADHSGATPMNLRADALVGAGEIIVGIEEIASKKVGSTAVATVGFANAIPGVLNVIPGEVVLGIDIRDIDNDNLQKADKLIRELIADVTNKRGLTYELKQLTKDTPVKLSDEMVELIEKEADKLHVQSIRLPSGAGHDAMHMPSIASLVGMIFIPCKDGISHNTAESINMEDAYIATEILAKTLVELSNR
jgi:N-carbamoyl-L-amino-acid hydrolase